MFAFKFATLLAVVSSVFAMPAPSSGACGTGKLQCCDSIQPANSTNVGELGGLIPIGLLGTDVPIGLNCLPINLLGLGSAGTCSAQAACCNDVTNSGTLPIGVYCSPINLGL